MDRRDALAQPPADELNRRTRELERLRQQLEQSEARFRNIIERNADAIVVVDRDGVLQFANDEAVKLFGSPREDLIGNTFGFPLVTGETTELDLLSEAGPRMVEMRVVQSLWEGQPAHIATLRDVTERNLAEQSARRLIREQAARGAAETALHRFHFLADASVVLSSSLDYAATLSRVAQLCVAEIADWVIIYTIDDQAVVRRLEVVHRAADKAALARELRDAAVDPSGANPVHETLSTGRPQVIEQVTPELLEKLIRDPRQRELFRELGLAACMFVPMIARDRVLGAIALICTDRTHVFDESELALATDLAARAALAIDNARLYEQAREANQTKTELLALISHDLRTPLNSIIGYAQLLKLGIPDVLPDGAQQRIERIGFSASHLLYLIDELLAYARLDSGHEEARPRATDVRAIVEEVASVMEPLAQERGLGLRVDLSASPVTFRTDPDKLRQVLVNLVANAVKYTEQGEVFLQVRVDPNGRLRIDVSDTGPGIAPDNLPHIFQPFWQADRTQRTRGGGTGLGLAVVRQVVQLLQGRIHVDSTVGKGTTFSLELPPSPQPADSVEPQASA